ncbi:MAG TPA: MBL fold metallo-hydrolase [Terriglobia bacterium]|nr:MBL fold metallo-hydrolase [Terriglobia bacterium]
MCDVSRRQFLAGGTAFLSLAAEKELLAGPMPAGMAEASKADQVAPDVYFHQGVVSDTADAVCNNGWIIFEDYVLVIDANFPAGAKLIISRIRSLTDKPIRFAFDTHHHGDHAYGNQVFVENGAVPVAHTGVIEEMKRYETGYYGSKPGAWEDAAKGRADLRTSRLKPPSVLFSKDLFFDDGKHRVELLHLGVGHTHGDALAWLPKERILFTGDVCVNGPYNYVGDGDVGKWSATLGEARKLGAKVVCTGHGPRSVATVLEDQQAFFKQLQEQVETRMAKSPPEGAKGEIESIRAALKGDPQIARYVGDSLPAQVAKVYEELTGKKLAALMQEPNVARHAHARSHGLVSA